MSSPLEKLAWSALTEKAIIARVANQLLRRNIDGRRGEKTAVKDAVRESCPPRGFLGSRYEGVLKELKRQKPIRHKRAYSFAPYEERQLRVTTRRNRVAKARLGAQTDRCSDVRTTPGHAIYVVGRYEYGCLKRYLAVRHFRTGETSYIKIPRQGARKVSEAIAALHPKETSRVLRDGGFYTVDFCRMVTTIHPPHGASYDLPWEIEGETLTLGERKAQCEN